MTTALRYPFQLMRWSDAFTDMVIPEITIRNGDRSLTLPAKIDTGASLTALPASAMERLGITPEDCQLGQVQTHHTGYKASFLPAGLEGRLADYRFRLAGKFNPPEGLPYALLGMHDFLAAFRLTVDQSAREFTLEPVPGRALSTTTDTPLPAPPNPATGEAGLPTESVIARQSVAVMGDL